MAASDTRGRPERHLRQRDDWTQPTLQERRAIIYAARQEMAGLTELIDALDR